MASPTPVPARAERHAWSDRWLLGAFSERGVELGSRALTAASAWEALEQAGVPSAEIVGIVAAMSAVTEADLTSVGATHADLLSQELSLRYDVVPVALEGRTLVVATANPLRANLDRDLAFACGKTVSLRVAHPATVRATRQRVYAGFVDGVRRPRLEWVTAQQAVFVDVPSARGSASDALDAIIVDAMDQRASDIHLEPKEGEILVRYRVDGMLHDVTRISAELTPLVLSRLKIGAGLDIANRRRPQDGRASIVFDDRPIDLRVSTLPLGERIEKAVIRILDASATTLAFDKLGFSESEATALRRILSSSEGMVLVTGPTGSGKTTTLYSALLHLASPETNIMTVEDPIEYRLAGINQVQVESRQGLTFASVLRSLLRQDPDVLLVGEIRDAETAEIAVRASITGHLVLSTLHTNDAVSAITRLDDIGLDLANVATALRAVISQRLVRRLCTECSEPIVPAKVPNELRWLLGDKDITAARHAVGCAACRGTGYRGRLAIAELLVIDEESRQLMTKSADRRAMLQLACRSGMQPLWDVGMKKVLAGLTSLEELASHVTPPLPMAVLPQDDVDALLTELLGKGTVAPAPASMAKPVSAEPATAPRPLRGPPAARAVSRLVVAPRRDNGDATARVLVVHERFEVRRELRSAFERVGCVVLEAADGEAALTYAACLRPDAVVTDVALPRLDGVGLAQALLAETIVDDVFVCTDQRDEQMLQWISGTGVRDVIGASADVDAIAGCVLRQLSRAGQVLKVV
ncbi:MAG: Flp pilus assembly complex ATPase component TadA [Proteobacteria bacterium]|nr:Flp pilus assembly complex ATPase component TadA [Pseudomonadota bacterium]